MDELKNFLGELIRLGKPYLIAIGVVILVSWGAISAIHRVSGKKLPRPIRAALPIVLSFIYYIYSWRSIDFQIVSKALAVGALATSAYEIAVRFLLKFLEAKGEKLIRREKADTPTDPKP